MRWMTPWLVTISPRMTRALTTPRECLVFPTSVMLWTTLSSASPSSIDFSKLIWNIWKFYQSVLQQLRVTSLIDVDMSPLVPVCVSWVWWTSHDQEPCGLSQPLHQEANFADSNVEKMLEQKKFRQIFNLKSTVNRYEDCKLPQFAKVSNRFHFLRENFDRVISNTKLHISIKGTSNKLWRLKW